MWSCEINLKICHDLSRKVFLRSFHLLCFDHEIPENYFSDLGIQLVAGANIIQNFLSDPETHNFFQQHNVELPKFEHFFKGKSELGSLVEVCVKVTKWLIFGAINNVLSLHDFEFLVCHFVHLANRRPVEFKYSVLDSDIDIPETLTPESFSEGRL